MATPDETTIDASRLEDESRGRCRVLLWIQGGEVVLCNQPTRRRDYHYCYSCWNRVHHELELPVFPPMQDLRETRYCIGEKTVFKLRPKQFLNYSRPRAVHATPPLENEALFVGSVRRHNGWAAGDAKHEGRWTVYVLRLKDGSLYVGQTRKSAEAREAEHRQGIGARVCREKGVAGLVYFTEASSRQVALEAETLLYETLRRAGTRISTGDDPDG